MGDPAWGLPLRIRWDEGLSLVSGDGALPGCAVPAPGTSLAEALQVDGETARAIDSRGRTGGGVEFVRAGPVDAPRWLRISMVPGAATTIEARVQDVGALLDGAPPLQI